MKKRVLGKNSLTVSEIGLGCMTIGKDYSEDSKNQAIKIIRRAYELGITMFDTAELYGGAGRNENLVGEALKPIRDKVVIATKCGVQFTGGHMVMDSRPETIRTSVEGSLRRLQTEYIDLYYTHRVDPNVPIETVAETMAQLHKEGKILNWGVSEPGIDTLRRANAVFPVPIWWYIAPTIMNTFLESYDFSGKTIVLFATSGGSGFGETVKALQDSVSPSAKIVEGKVFGGRPPMADIQSVVEKGNQ